MRIRITQSNQKLVNKSRGKNLSANAEVNRALTEYYANHPKANPVVLTKEVLESLLGNTNVRRFLKTE